MLRQAWHNDPVRLYHNRIQRLAIGDFADYGDVTIKRLENNVYLATRRNEQTGEIDCLKFGGGHFSVGNAQAVIVQFIVTGQKPRIGKRSILYSEDGKPLCRDCGAAPRKNRSAYCETCYQRHYYSRSA